MSGLSSASSMSWHREVSPAAWRALRLAGLGWTFDVFDSFLLALTLPALITTFSLSKADAGAIGSVLAAGLVLGGMVFGWLADRLGRVRTLMICVFLYSAFSGLTAFAPTAGWVAALRFLAGIGMGGAWTCGAALVTETWDPKHRGKGGALMQMGLPVGSMLAIGTVALVDTTMGGLSGYGWRIVYLIGFVPAVLLFFVARVTPESPEWLRHRSDRRTRVKDGAGRPNWGPKFLTRLALAFGFIFFAQYIYWGVFTWTPAFLVTAKQMTFVHSLGFTLTQQLGSLVGFLVFAALVDRLGRRPAFTIFLLVGAVAVAAFITVETASLLLVAMFFTGFGITGIFGGMSSLTAELAPDGASRGLFMGLAYNGGRLGGLLAPYLIGSLATTDANFLLGMATTIPAFILAIVVVGLMPETKGTTLA